ncbi:hypothetical protein [Aquabacterium sp.]|uniref:hypothetical protein n=1 Tax=Aquabacterium sp. TaxID=1872578 RepID=UPI0035B221E1
MSHDPSTEHAAHPEADPSGHGTARTTRARIEHLFRFSLRQQQLNPLMYIVLRHRGGVQEQEHGSGI